MNKSSHMFLTKKRYFNLPIIILLSICIQGCKDKQSSTEEVVKSEAIQTDTSKASTESSQKNILCFGNSLTAGYGIDDESKIWPTLLQKRIDSLELGYNVINAGLSGETTAGGAGRIDWVLNQKVDIFFLELGANDMLRGLDVNSTNENLKKILDKVHAKYPGIPIVLAGMMAPPNMGKDYEKAYNAIFPTLSKEYKAALIPFFLEGVAGIPELNLKDGKHPNENGQLVVLENVWQAMSPLLK